MKKLFFLFLIMSMINVNAQKADVIIHTDAGKISVRLFDETPKHKANFLKLASEGFYDGIEFHRVIKDFMVQGGDPAAKVGGKPEDTNSKPGYLIDAEMNPKYVHTRGMLAAARMGDQVNPEQKSSGSQFYIVTGTKQNDQSLDGIEKQTTGTLTSKRYSAEFLQMPENQALYKNMQELSRTNRDSAQKISAQINQKFSEYVKTKPPVELKYTPEQREKYKAQGGTPFLDMQYTVFGEVLEGMEAVDTIQNAQTSKPGDKPLQPIRIIKMEVVK
jgi:cyclophilin family peptidyl-prolyl cis-trans isomerase